jgi:hypothetical protein
MKTSSIIALACMVAVAVRGAVISSDAATVPLNEAGNLGNGPSKEIMEAIEANFANRYVFDNSTGGWILNPDIQVLNKRARFDLPSSGDCYVSAFHNFKIRLDCVGLVCVDNSEQSNGIEVYEYNSNRRLARIGQLDGTNMGWQKYDIDGLRSVHFDGKWDNVYDWTYGKLNSLCIANSMLKRLPDSAFQTRWEGGEG